MSLSKESREVIDKKYGEVLRVKLEDWSTLDRQVDALNGAIDILLERSGIRTSWAISSLVCDLVRAAEERALTLNEMKSFGVNTSEDAIRLLSLS